MYVHFKHIDFFIWNDFPLTMIFKIIILRKIKFFALSKAILYSSFKKYKSVLIKYSTFQLSKDNQFSDYLSSDFMNVINLVSYLSILISYHIYEYSTHTMFFSPAITQQFQAIISKCLGKNGEDIRVLYGSYKSL